MLDESTLFGFDTAADGALTVVQMRRTSAGWHVEQVDGPDNADLAHIVARITGGPPRPRPPSDGWPAIVEAWMAEHGDLTFRLTDDQRALLAAVFERHVADGTIRLWP